MVKFLRPTKFVIILQSCFIERKTVIIPNFDNGTYDCLYGYCLFTGISKYPAKVICKDFAKKTAKKSCVKAFIQMMNYSHAIPTKYTLDVELKDVVVVDALQSWGIKVTTSKEIKKRFEESFKNRKHKWFSSKLKF